MVERCIKNNNLLVKSVEAIAKSVIFRLLKQIINNPVRWCCVLIQRFTKCVFALSAVGISASIINLASSRCGVILIKVWLTLGGGADRQLELCMCCVCGRRVRERKRRIRCNVLIHLKTCAENFICRQSCRRRRKLLHVLFGRQLLSFLF